MSQTTVIGHLLVAALVAFVVLHRQFWLEVSRGGITAGLHGEATGRALRAVANRHLPGGGIALSLRGSSPVTIARRPRTNSRHAFAAVVWGEKSDAFLDLLVLVRSLREGGASSDVLALFPEESDALRWSGFLKHHGILSRVVPRIPLPASMHTEYAMRKWANVFSKFVIFNFTTTTTLLDLSAFLGAATNAGIVV